MIVTTLADADSSQVPCCLRHATSHLRRELAVLGTEPNSKQERPLCEISAVARSGPSGDHLRMEMNRVQQSYDHRLKKLVHSTGDIHIALA